MSALRVLVSVLAAALAHGQGFSTWVGDLKADSVLLAWGKPGPGNVIGLTAASYGKARVRVGPQTVESSKAWALVTGLEPDTRYDYSVEIGGQVIGRGAIRTWARSAGRVSFLVFGDWGEGSSEQARLGGEMAKLVAERQNGADPIRFVLTTGDNIYFSSVIFRTASGSKDVDWWPKYLTPYARLLSHIPMFPSLGNHDGNESERREDLPAYLDNFFFPGQEPARWYKFNYGGLADFFALDSTTNTESGPPAPAYLESGAQSEWLRQELAKSEAPWKIPYFHHPVFNAGPRHDSEDNEKRFRHWVDYFAKNGVRVVFQGHEHNFQISEANDRSRGIRFIVSGAGGELRRGNVTSSMKSANIAAWAAQRHFLLVEIQQSEMKVSVRSYSPVQPVDASKKPLPPEFRIELR